MSRQEMEEQVEFFIKDIISYTHRIIIHFVPHLPLRHNKARDNIVVTEEN